MPRTEHAGGPAERQLGLLLPGDDLRLDPQRGCTPSTKSARFSASRDAEVATNRIASTPSSVQISLYRRAASRVRASASGAMRPVRSTP